MSGWTGTIGGWEGQEHKSAGFHNRTGSKPPGNVAGVKAGVPGTHSSRGRGEGRGPKGSIGIDDADPVPTVAIPT
jgi:hypothetical protein